MEEMGHLVDKSEEHLYESISDVGVDEEPIYAEIEDYDSMYEVPIPPTQDQIYTDVIAEEEYYDQVADSDSHIYEEPITPESKPVSHNLNRTNSNTFHLMSMNESRSHDGMKPHYFSTHKKNSRNKLNRHQRMDDYPEYHQQVDSYAPPYNKKEKKESESKKLNGIGIWGSKKKKVKEGGIKESVDKEKDFEKLALLFNNIFKKFRLDDNARAPSAEIEVQSEPALGTPRLKVGRKVKSDDKEASKPVKPFGFKFKMPKNKSKNKLKEDLISSSVLDADADSCSFSSLDLPNLPEITDS